jgi:hypothetical protein
VVVPGEDPRHGGVRVLHVGVASIERVARTVVLERVRLGRAVAAHEILAPARFVDVIAEKGDEVRIVGEDVAVGVEITLLVLLAGGEGESQPSGALIR